MNANDIKAIKNRYQKKYERNWYNYQSSGERRYEREYQHAEDIVDICSRALNADMEHSQLLSIRGDMSQFSSEAMQILREESLSPRVEKLLRNIKASGLMSGLITDPYGRE